MDSLAKTLTQFDEIEINCLVHGIPSIGLCADFDCIDTPTFFCMKCIKEGHTCITTQNHELVSLSEVLYRFFVKQENKMIDLMEINSMIEIIKEIDQRELSNVLSQFLATSTKAVDKFRDELNATIKTVISKIESENENKIKEIEKSGIFNDKEKKDIDIMLNVKIPDILTVNTGISQEKLIDFIYPSLQTKTDKNKLINDIKFLSNLEQTEKTIEKIDSLKYLDKLTHEESKKIFEDKIDAFLLQYEEEFDKHLEELENIIIPAKNPELFFPSKNKILRFNSNPSNLVYKKDICDNAHKANSIDSVFTAFKTLKDEPLVVWGTSIYHIQFYDLNLDKVIKTISSAHRGTIFSCRHYVDIKNKRDLIITTSYDRSIKIWNIKDDYENILTIQQAHSGYYIYSACIVCDSQEGENYVISTAPNDQAKVWNFKGSLVRSFGVSNESTYFVDIFYEYKERKFYVLNANSTDVKSYIFATGELYKNYKGNPATWHMSALVYEIDGVLMLIESDGNGNIRLWGFHSGVLIKAIASVGILNLRGICLWNEEFLFSSGSDYQVKLYNLKEGKYVKGFTGHISTVCSAQKIVHPIYGECLISHGLDGKLKLWVNEVKK